MLAKITSKNQVTLPKAAVTAVGAAEYFDVEVRDGQIVLTPVRIQRGDAVRAKLAELGLGDADVTQAIDWARSGGAPRVAGQQPDYACAPPRPARKAASKKKVARRK